jgi:hypothetical protein
VGIASFGASNATATQSSSSEAVIDEFEKELGLPMLKSEGVVLTPDAFQQVNSDNSLPARKVREGQQLFKRLVADGLIQDASFRAFASYEQQDSDENKLYRIRKDGQLQIAFTTQTKKGRLQVTFSEKSIPSATLFPEDGGAVVRYTAADGESYDRFETDLVATSSDEDVSTLECTCSGCSCQSDWCYWDTVKTVCLSCNNGDCIATNSCGC